MTALLELMRTSTPPTGGALVLDGIDFKIDTGDDLWCVAWLIGRNGAGKTTTLMSIFRVPNVRGEILVEGKPLGKRMYQPASRGISLVPQGKHIFPNLTVEENIELGRASRRKGEWTLTKLFELFPNLGARKRPPGQPAERRGEQQMLAIAPPPPPLVMCSTAGRPRSWPRAGGGRRESCCEVVQHHPGARHRAGARGAAHPHGPAVGAALRGAGQGPASCPRAR